MDVETAWNMDAEQTGWADAMKPGPSGQWRAVTLPSAPFLGRPTLGLRRHVLSTVLVLFLASGCAENRDSDRVRGPLGAAALAGQSSVTALPRTLGVCPPFRLRDDAGNVIDPIAGVNANVPYSPKQTCGASGCHDYEKITEGYHFTQGAGEAPTPDQVARIGWASTPGNYGGNWCSPAPLYRYLSPKSNPGPEIMDMTSFSFLTGGCGACHPGGGPAEYDREGRRYDRWMSDPTSGFEPGGKNEYDGDYHQARWSETGVLEADCLLCHLPGYDYERRAKAIELHNLRWAATAGASLATVSGSLKDGKPVSVVYDDTRFHPDGTIDLHMVRSPRNEACLSCHAQPGWKKRGANYRARTDVHLRASLRCVDCHPAGSSATDARINGREVHQIAKGDDPGGLVRNDLDNTVVGCSQCHDSGRLGAPIPKHRGLPPLHLVKIACQACHIPERAVMPICVQASDVFNPAPHISGSKRLWTFYGPDENVRNHYGLLKMMGYDDKPTEIFLPVLARYGGKIFPVNRVHTGWPGIEVAGRGALMQPRMSDVMKMWTSHRADPTKYPALAEITDDTADGVPEVNRPAEIDALIASVTSLLADLRYPMEGKRVVWVMNDRVHTSGTDFHMVAKWEWEASPYGNVHKYSHDVYPARAALGTRGCGDCHGNSSPFLFANVLKYPFDPSGQPVTEPQHELLGISRRSAQIGVWREAVLKPVALWLIAATIALLLLHLTIFGVCRAIPEPPGGPVVVRLSLLERMTHFVGLVSLIGLGITGIAFLLGKSDPFGPWARELHPWLGWLFVAALVILIVSWARCMLFQCGDGLWLRRAGGYWGGGAENLPAGRFNAGQKVFFWVSVGLGALLAITGAVMFFSRNDPDAHLAELYTLHDLAAAVLLPMILVHGYLGLVANPGTCRSIFGGKVGKTWLRHHHPNYDIEEPRLREENP